MTLASGVPPAIEDNWLDFLDDVEVTVEEYREKGFDVADVYPGDVVPLMDRVALDVLVPGNDFEDVQELTSEFNPEYSIYKATRGGMIFTLIVAEDPDREVAVCCPVFYSQALEQRLAPAAKKAGFLQIQVRPLSDDEHVIFRIEDPAIVFE